MRAIIPTTRDRKYSHSLNFMLFLSNLYFVLKLIAHPSKRYNVISVRSQIVSEIFNVRIDSPVIAEEIVTPYIAQQLIA